MASLSNYISHRLLFQVLLSLILSVSAWGQPVMGGGTDSGLGGGNRAVGTVLGAAGERIESRVQVRLGIATRSDRIAVTDERGNFAFFGLVSGNYSIVIDKEKDYEPFTQTFDVIQLPGSPPSTYTINVRLTLKAVLVAKPEVVNAAFADVPQPALDFYKKALELSGAGDHKGAVEQLMLSTAEYPKFMLGFNEMGVQYLRLNEMVLADEAFLAALEIAPEAFEPLMNHGIVLFQMKKYADAEPVLRKVVKSSDKSAVGHYFLGQALANLGNFEEGEKELLLSLELGGDQMNEARRTLAIIHSARGEKARAAGELETYLRIAPNTRDAEQLRNVILQLKGSNVPSKP